MGRLSREQWEQARAEYEIRGVSLGELAKRYDVATSSVSRKAKSDGWTQGQMQDLANRKVAAIKEIAQIETQTQDLPLRFRHTLESVVREKLEAEGLLAELDVALATKAIEMAGRATSADELETLSRARKNLAPQVPKEGTTVNVTQQQAQGVQMLSPKDSLAEIVEGAREDGGE